MSHHDQVPVHQYVCTGDDLANDDNIRLLAAWKAGLLAPPSLRALEAFVGKAMHGTASYVEDMRGSYNMVLKFRVVVPAVGAANHGSTSGQHVVLRLPLRGFYPPVLVAEMLEAEVAWLQYFAAHGIARVPAVYAWSAASDNGIDNPYILLEFVDGKILNTCLEGWARSENPEDQARLHAAFEDIAAIQLAMYRHRFDKIGALRPSADGQWAITQRPVTHAMRDILLNAPGSTADGWPRGPLSTAADYKALFLQLHRTYQDGLRNINMPGHWTQDDGEILWKPDSGDAMDMDVAKAKAAGRIVARHGFAHPACLPCLAASGDTGPFAIFNRDFHPRNMIVNPATGRLVAVIDLEGTNALPAVFAEDPPLFLRPFNLFLVIVLRKLPQWEQAYAPLLDTYLDIMQRLEAQQPPPDSESESGEEGQSPLSARMRASWESKQWLEHFAVHDLDSSDYIFWSHLHGRMKSALDAREGGRELEPEIEAYQRHTEQQIADYENERIARQGH